MSKSSGFWRICRTIFRHFRRLIIFVVLILICAVVWLNQVGLPDFVKRPLVETLQAHGVELEFSRLRLNLRRGLVATDVRIGRSEKVEGPALSVRQMQLRLNYRALLHCQLQVDGLVLRQGKLVWPLSPTNALELDQIQSQLRFQPNNTWALDNFRADFAGIKLMLSGGIAHARAIRNWKIFQHPKSNAAALRVHWRKFTDKLRQIHFAGTPELSVAVNGDARDPRSFRIHLLGAIPAAKTPWGNVRAVQLIARLAAPVETVTNLNPLHGWWTNLEPYRIEWTAQLADLEAKELKVRLVRCGGSWSTPELVVTNLFAELGGGQLDASAQINLGTRRLSFTNSSRFDPHAIAALLTEKTRDWLAQFSWTQPPALQARGSLTLPDWTHRRLDWRDEVQPTVRIDGRFVVTNSTFHGIAVDSAQGLFSYSNLVWRIPRLIVERPEGVLKLADTEDNRKKSYHWHVQGALAPTALRPLLASSHAEKVLDSFTFTHPLYVNADVWGRLHDDDSIGAAGWAALTNFTIHGEAVSSAESAFVYTNRLLEFFRPRLLAGAQRMMADGIAIDFNSWRIYFTNGFSTVDPRAVARAIGPKPDEVMEPYHFGLPCPTYVNGYAPLRGLDDADLWFELKGAPLDWLKLKTPRIAGKVHWMGRTLVLTNAIAEFYDGKANGFAHFDFRSKEGVDFAFTANVTNADVHLLAADLSSPTNHLEGRLSGRFVMTSANSENWRTWNGYGRATLRDGLIWDVPIFGILSPILNSIMPGLGSSRATDATAQFGMTNGVIFSDDLKMRTMMMRLEYNGTVDLQSHVQATVTAQLLRDTWVVGPLLSTAFWPVSKLFEYKITGTLSTPRSEPVVPYVPKILLLPLHPIRGLEALLPGVGSTNAPPER